MPRAPGDAPVKRRVRPKKSRAKPAGVFAGPPQKATAPITHAQTQARKRVRRATRKVERNVVLPYVPKLKHPTQHQRQEAASQTARSLHRQGVNTMDEVRALPKAQRERFHRASGYSRTATKKRYVAKALLAGEKARTQQELAKAGRRIAAHDTVKPGAPHVKVAGFDPTPLLKAIGGRLHGNPLAAIGTGISKAVKEGYASDPAKFLIGGHGIGANALRDVIDLPSNVVTSTYLIGKTAATGHPGKAAKMLADPIVHTIEHPVKSFEEHPLNTDQIGRGVKGAVGHGVGKAMRVGPETSRRLASTDRGVKRVPGTRLTQDRKYSKDVITKAGQVAAERVGAKHPGARRAMRKATFRENVPPDQMTAREVRRRVDADVEAAKQVTRRNQPEAKRAAAKAIGYKRGRKPSAAVNLAAQGITTASHADLMAYLKEIRARAPKLKTDREIKANQQAQKLIEDALRNHDPVSVQRAADAYAKVAGPLEQQMVAHNMVDPATAVERRLEGVRVRRVTRSSSPDTRIVRKRANKALKQAKLEARRAKAALATAETEATALPGRRGGIGTVPAVQQAKARYAAAQAALEQAQVAAHTAQVAHIRAHMTTEPGEPAFVSHQPIPPRAAAIPLDRPGVVIAKKATGQAIRGGTIDVHPAKLLEQAEGTQRLIDAATARNRTIETYGYRKGGDPASDLRSFKTEKGAKAYVENKLRGGWTPIRREDGQYSLIPDAAHQRLKAHQERVKIAHPLVQGITNQWRRNVLAFNPRWFFGNQLEAAVRSLAAGAGPLAYHTARKVKAAMDPESRRLLEAHTSTGGHYAMSDRLIQDRYITRAAEDLSRAAQAFRAFRQAPGPKQLADAYGAVTHWVFNSVNGRMESQFQTAMLGKALRDHPLMEGRIRKLSRDAVEEAARGLTDTNVQADLGRAVRRMYGAYGSFSPRLQSLIANYTPFIAWTLNATKFLTVVLPKDHPVLTGLLAAENEATYKWRKQHGLVLDPFGHYAGEVAPFLAGSIPGKGGSHLRLSRYTPFGATVNSETGAVPILGQLESLVLPQISEVQWNLLGMDWKQAPLAEAHGKNTTTTARSAVAAMASAFESMVPLASQGLHIAGVRTPNTASRDNVSSGVGTRAREQFDPLRFTPAKKTVRRSSGGGSGAVTWGSGASNVQWGNSDSNVTWGTK